MTSQSSVGGAWSTRGFVPLVFSVLLSEVGRAVVALVLPLLTWAATGSGWAVGLVEASFMVAALVVGLPAGLLVDRVSRRAILVAAGLLLGAGYGLLAVAGHLGTLALVVVAFVLGGLTLLAEEVEGAAGQSLVGDDPDLNSSVVQVRFVAGGVVAGAAPLVGGMLFAVWSLLPVLVAVVAVVLSAVAASRIPFSLRPPAPEGETGPYLSEALAGVRRIRSDSLLLPLAGAATLVNLAWAMFGVTVLIGLQRQGVPPGQIGAVMAASGVALIVGGAAARRLGNAVATGHLLLVAGSVMAVVIAGLSLMTGRIWVPVVAGGVAVLGLALGPMNVPLNGWMRARTPENLQGRVFAAMGVLQMGLAPAGAGVAGVLVDELGWSGTLAITAGVQALGVLALGLSRDVRRLPSLAGG